ncbi:(2Fe-2S)-binding protein [Candidatus Igneacidithiobacillus taiwanensis]|jgi:bacterioferritin-associated ferredoxin|uniref:(2Fe-2S)-binding protein n=1 Tax=Candidatus Igneacidithiobacillus taiwanensis TaxID=1945924 RepID=UPI00289FCE88|nr:(2Fe-2S)-binding protein [Candidatus Igneacidithiobacillus taiwanensis]MCE5361050.1 (2Fe-2S)-binding protein [Acidithiobacillus sp.]
MSAEAQEVDDSPYCCCSAATFQEILARQRAQPLPFMELLMVHAGCGSGCGSCIEELEQYLRAHDAYIED